MVQVSGIVAPHPHYKGKEITKKLPYADLQNLGSSGCPCSHQGRTEKQSQMLGCGCREPQGSQVQVYGRVFTTIWGVGVQANYINISIFSRDSRSLSFHLSTYMHMHTVAKNSPETKSMLHVFIWLKLSWVELELQVAVWNRVLPPEPSRTTCSNSLQNLHNTNPGQRPKTLKGHCSKQRHTRTWVMSDSDPQELNCTCSSLHGPLDSVYRQSYMPVSLNLTRPFGGWSKSKG